MARREKRTVDYFPHDCKHGKSMKIVERKHGNDGYAFWFKTLELLGSTEGHFLDLTCPVAMEYLSALTYLPISTIEEILDLLSTLGSIDKELWETKKIVWSQNFVDNLSELYKRRKTDIPLKPGTEVNVDINPINVDINEVNVDIKPQSRVNKSRVNKSKEKKVAYSERVSLTVTEYESLVGDVGEVGAKWIINKLDSYKQATGRTYKSDAGAIRTWVMDEYKKKHPSKPPVKRPEKDDAEKAYIEKLKRKSEEAYKK